MYKHTKRKEVIYPKLSYKIVGCLFEVYKNIGGNHKENYYQNALRKEFINKKIKFQEQVYSPLIYKGNKVGKYFLDFLVEDKIVLELKKGSVFHKENLDQVLNYLKSSDLKLGIIANYTRDGVKFYRVLNIN